jgi:hypothetical protein
VWRTSAAYVEDLFLVSADIAAKAEGGDETIGIAAEMLFSGASLVFVGVSRRVSLRSQSVHCVILCTTKKPTRRTEKPLGAVKVATLLRQCAKIDNFKRPHGGSRAQCRAAEADTNGHQRTRLPCP